MVQLTTLPPGLRFGLACLVLVLLFGLGTGAAHLVLHHENRDGVAGLTLDDVRGAYHGITAEAPLHRALAAGHGEQLTAAERRALLDWLAIGQPDRLAAAFDDERLGELAPGPILDRRCLSCHSRQADDERARQLPLEYWDDIRDLAVARDVAPTDAPIVVASAHTHALAMGSLTVIAVLLALGTRCSRRLLSPLAAMSGLGLLLDLGAWLPVRAVEGLVYVLVGGGAMWLVTTTALLLLVLVDLARPAPRAPAA